VIEADVRASGSIIMGCSCTIQANVVADKHVFLGPFCRFSGVINAGGELLLSSGTRGFQSEGMVIAYAGSTLSVETDVAIRGKLSAGERVAVVNSAASKAWRKRHRISQDGLPAELGKGV
jgi:predicted acyltransferase (DUF342 family)